MKKTTTPISLAGSQLGDYVMSAHFSIMTTKSIACCFHSFSKGSSVATRRFTS
jgi:hypothetical protein